MTYKRYEEYKSSEIDWVNEIPKYWGVSKIKYIKSKEKNSFVDGPFGSNLKSEHFKEDGEVYVIESNFATRGILNFEQLKKIKSSHFESIKRSEAKKGDIIIAKIGEYYGLSNILPYIDKKAVISGNSLKLTVDSKKILNEYLHYQLLELKRNGTINLLSNSTAQPALSLGGMNTIKIVLPNIEEQKKIVEFLKIRISEINTLIKEKEKLIELLKEKREVIVTEYVTKGIDKNVEMKDSGVDWIGKIPFNWNVTKLKYIADSEKYSIVDGPFGSDMKNEEYVDDGVPIIQLNNIGDGVHKFNNIKYITEEKAEALKRHMIYPGDIVIAKMMPAGRATIVSDKFNKYIVSSDSIRLKINNRNNHEFIMYCLNAYGRIQAELNSNGSTRSRINLSIIKNTKIAICDKEEQERIIKHLNKKLSCIDNLINENSSIISKLEEYKNALISEVVTGKIDVRNYEE